MKTWTNPTVEELKIMLTADGDDDFYLEKLPFMPDYDVWNDKLLTQS